MSSSGSIATPRRHSASSLWRPSTARTPLTTGSPSTVAERDAPAAVGGCVAGRRERDAPLQETRGGAPHVSLDDLAPWPFLAGHGAGPQRSKPSTINRRGFHENRRHLG